MAGTFSLSPVVIRLPVALVRPALKRLLQIRISLSGDLPLLAAFAIIGALLRLRLTHHVQPVSDSAARMRVDDHRLMTPETAR
jgi:hypothetical protein